MESSFRTSLEFQDGISHQAAEPEWMETSFRTSLEFQDGISHQAAEPEWMESSFRTSLEFQDGISHQAAKPQRYAPQITFRIKIPGFSPNSFALLAKVLA